MNKLLKDLKRLGFTIGVAHGDAQVEHDRLDELEASCTAAAIRDAAADIGKDAAAVCRQRGMTDADLIATVAGVIEEAHAQLTDHATSALEHQRRAIEVAEQMPTVYRIEWADEHGTLLSLLVAETDEETLASLADKKAHKERLKQHAEAHAQ